MFLISQKMKNSVNLFEKCGPKMFFFRLLGHHFAKILLFGANKTTSRFHALHASRFCKRHPASANLVHLASANSCASCVCDCDGFSRLRLRPHLRLPPLQIASYLLAFTLSTYFLIPSTPSEYMSTNFVAKGGIFPGCIPSASCITST